MVCGEDDKIYSAFTVIPTATYSADFNEQYKLDISKLRGIFTDSDVSFEFLPDGRLTTINATQIGEGDKIVKAAAPVVTAVASAALLVKQKPTACEFIKHVGGGSPIVLTYKDTISFNKNKETVANLKLDAASQSYADTLGKGLTNISVISNYIVEQGKPPFDYHGNTGKAVIKARQPALFNVTLRVTNGKVTEDLWGGTVAVGQYGTKYDLPIPRAVVFGKETLMAKFSESGALQSVQYGSNSGADQALNTANTVITAAQGESAAVQAEQVKAEADLIAQQQRLLQCRTEPKSCTK